MNWLKCVPRFKKPKPIYREPTEQQRQNDARLDAMIANAETGSSGCLDCEIGEPHACEIAHEQHRILCKSITLLVDSCGPYEIDWLLMETGRRVDELKDEIARLG